MLLLDENNQQQESMAKFEMIKSPVRITTAKQSQEMSVKKALKKLN